MPKIFEKNRTPKFGTKNALQGTESLKPRFVLGLYQVS